MAIRITVDIPEPLHAALRLHAQRSGTSIRALVIGAIEHAYSGPKGERVKGPLVTRKGKLGPRFPVDKTPHDLILP